ncbi:MAG: hypothetical protein JST40_11580 [Armatimonadetes bacterium]|nr:hypothetical protein [Armatimonadota bacterium]
MKNIFRACAISVIAVLAVAAFAQPGGGGGGNRGGMRGGGGFGMRGGMTSLLSRKDVQKDMALSADVIKKIEDLNESQREAMRNMMQGGERPSASEMQDMMTKNEKAYMALLNDGQKTRLKEIFIQVNGNRALSNETIQTDLGFTAEQKKKVKDLQTKQGEAMQAVMEKMRNGEIQREEIQTIMEKNNKIMDEELAKILTADQKTKFKAMEGKKFTSTEQPGGPGGGRGNRGGGGGNGGGRAIG